MKYLLDFEELNVMTGAEDWMGELWCVKSESILLLLK